MLNNRILLTAFQKIKEHWPVLFTAALLFVLLLRNPYSERTLIPNFEPFPDTFHYILPPLCWLKGEGWELCRSGFEGIPPAVPPLYSIFLLPAFLVSTDPRSFYFVNVILAGLSLLALYSVAKTITDKKLAVFLVCFLFVTSYQVYWVPSLAMAENLFIPLFLTSIWLVIQKKQTLWQLAGLSLLAGLQYGTKFVGLPLMVGLIGVTGLRLILEHSTYKISSQKLFFLLAPATVLFLAFGGWSTIASVVDFSNLVSSVTPAQSSTTTAASTDSGWFELSYFQKNILIYLAAVMGKSTRFLWDYTPLINQWMAAGAGLGILAGLIQKRWRWLSLTLLACLSLQLLLLSLFYTTDARYIFTVLPTGMIGLLLLFETLFKLAKKFPNKLSIAQLNVVLLLLFVGYSLSVFTRIKSQIGLNLKYSESPWWYLAVKELDSFSNQVSVDASGKKPFIITPMAPFLIDFYSSKQLQLLPLHEQQDFRHQKPQVWGIANDQNLLDYYQTKINEGYPVYLALYGIGNESHLKEAYSEIEQSFQLTKVHTGCYELCSIFKLDTKVKTKPLN